MLSIFTHLYISCSLYYYRVSAVCIMSSRGKRGEACRICGGDLQGNQRRWLYAAQNRKGAQPQTPTDFSKTGSLPRSVQSSPWGMNKYRIVHFMHLADAFIQCIQYIHFISMCAALGSNPWSLGCYLSYRNEFQTVFNSLK